MEGKQALAFPEACVALAIGLPALMGHLLLLVADAGLLVEIHPAFILLEAHDVDVHPCDHWTILDHFKEFVLV